MEMPGRTGGALPFAVALATRKKKKTVSYSKDRDSGEALTDDGVILSTQFLE